MKYAPLLVMALLGVSACQRQNPEKMPVPANALMIRIAKIEIEPQDVQAYLAILKEESAVSVQLEPGVISIYPMYQKEAPTQVRILEIYSDRAAYEAHLQTPHFKKYKTSTLDMVKGLELVEMEAVDPESMGAIFKKFDL